MNNPAFDSHFPPRGPCAFCEHQDARHRIWDTIGDRYDAGDSIQSLAHDYGVPISAIVGALDYWLLPDPWLNEPLTPKEESAMNKADNPENWIPWD